MEHITHLIPLSEFVAKAESDFEKLEIDINDFYHLVTEYNNFLQQPLELCQFVAVGDNNEVLEEPEHYKEWVAYTNDGWEPEYDAKVMEAYNKVKESCLFEGWRIKGIDEGLWELENTSQDVWITFVGKDAEIINFDGYESSIETVEEMFEYCHNKGFVLPLTQSALKQIY